MYINSNILQLGNIIYFLTDKFFCYSLYIIVPIYYYLLCQRLRSGGIKAFVYIPREQYFFVDEKFPVFFCTPDNLQNFAINN